MTEQHGREHVHVTYRMGDGREAQTIVSPQDRDALHRGGHLIGDHGDSRLLASMDRWSSTFFGHLLAPRGRWDR